MTTITVGILTAKEVHFRLDTPYIIDNVSVEGEQTAIAQPDGILWQGKLFNEITALPQGSHSPKGGAGGGLSGGEAVFRLYGVTIGKQFHWERQQVQVFTGTLHLVWHEGQIVVINELPLEDYLISVISSEMKSTCSLEFLKASAVISRSWLLAQLRQKQDKSPSFIQTDEELIRWWDREDHDLFDVCADDHCQRYQGITKASNPNVRRAVNETCGQVLMGDGEICDARFGKCCGGQTNEFQYCWQNIRKSYLSSVVDPFCNTSDREVLTQVLNDYDLETNNFYRWQVRFTQERLRELIERNLGMKFGHILRLEPLEAGPAGHISRLRIVGSERTFIIGKELMIRKTLSTSHLLSSAFTVSLEDLQDNVPQTIILNGKGWGHGVGMCQIGAAVMGHQGYSYQEILSHYYPGAEIRQIY
ncbi:MAG: SpoIID/LytB domain-containing protein [Bacteroidaceae bacterium]|nr:SpoIID/LytB domain-containing protein [Bacteroidaceae bacterium]